MIFLHNFDPSVGLTRYLPSTYDLLAYTEIWILLGQLWDAQSCTHIFKLHCTIKTGLGYPGILDQNGVQPILLTPLKSKLYKVSLFVVSAIALNLPVEPWSKKRKITKKRPRMPTSMTMASYWKSTKGRPQKGDS